MVTPSSVFYPDFAPITDAQGPDKPIDRAEVLLCRVLVPLHFNPPFLPIVGGGWTGDTFETGLAAEPDRNWRGYHEQLIPP